MARVMSGIRDLIIFASDAEIMAMWGAGFLLVAVLANLAERLRMKRARIDRLGWMPWTQIFLACLVIGGGLLSFSLPRVIAG